MNLTFRPSSVLDGPKLREDCKSIQSRAESYILSKIREGTLRPGDHLPSMQELSKELKVSTKPVYLATKVMRERGFLNQIKRRRLVISDEAKYLALKGSLKIAFCSCGIGHIRHPFYQAVFNYLTKMCRKANFEIDCILDEIGNLPVESNPGFDVLVVTDWQPQNFKKLCHGPVIGIDVWKDVETTHVVKTDHFLGGELIAKHLWQSGRRNIVYFDLVPEITIFKGSVHRRLGFMKGWVDAGGELADIKILPVICNPEKMAEAVRENARTRGAFFCYADRYALEIMGLLEKMGVKVPDDIAIAGYDGIYEAFKNDPPLTTVVQPAAEIARNLFDIIYKMIVAGQKDGVEKEVNVPPRLVIGGTT